MFCHYHCWMLDCELSLSTVVCRRCLTGRPELRLVLMYPRSAASGRRPVTYHVSPHHVSPSQCVIPFCGRVLGDDMTYELREDGIVTSGKLRDPLPG